MMEPTEIVAAKRALRLEMLQQRDTLNTASKKEYDQAICAKLLAHISEKNYQVIHCFLSMGTEINLMPLLAELLKEGKTVVCPQTLKKRQLQSVMLEDIHKIETGLYNTLQPAQPKPYDDHIDFIIVPGLAFDANYYRLGYGGGYYDGFLGRHPEAKKMAIAYPFQMVNTVPREAHDVALDGVFYFEGLI